jgi:aspartyl-tRNA(Asn)/glutamyl-tRNA(Gln) amidotransferase subunit B
VPNRAAIEDTIKLGHALGSEIAERAVFHRKNYFYPDNPKAYQISQYDEPLCRGGRLTVPTEAGTVDVGIVRAHLEEDAAKNVHVAASGRIHGATATLVDFNRCGTPLLEIVTEPDIHSADLAKRFLQLLRQTVVELDISDAELEKGTMRFDVNVSVRPEGTGELRTRTELKNMNSFNFAAQGIRKEVERQIEIYERGGTVEQETLHFDPNNEDSPPLRSKEEAQDYRYFPEPDLVPVHPPAELVERLRGEVGELPSERIGRIARTLSFDDAEKLVTGGLDRLWSATVDAGADPKEAANVIGNPFVATGVDPARVDPGELAKLVSARTEIRRDAFDEALAHVGDEGFAAEPYLAQKTVSDASALDPIIDEVVAANPDEAAAYRGGKDGLLGFFVGQVMRATGGTADPRVVNERLREKLRA